MNTLRHFFTFEGRIDRRTYLISGTLLLLLKYALDHTIAAHFGFAWPVWSYFLPAQAFGPDNDPQRVRNFYLILWAVAIPFFWTGISLTVRRLRDAGNRLGWVFLFFVPFANLAFFLTLSALPTASSVEQQHAATQDAETLATRPTAMIFGILLAALAGLVLVALGILALHDYAWGVFLGVPFAVGFVASFVLNRDVVHSRPQSITAAIGAISLMGAAFIGFRWEGAVCLLMALPLAIPFAIAGALTARRCFTARYENLQSPTILSSFALLPMVFFAEHAANLEPPTRPVVTTIDIAAPAAVVWKNVIAFPPLPPPTEPLFMTGIAYPIGATISGSGPGAIRRCRFSTGDFVEPITTWDENRLLAFTVTEEPPSLKEWTWGAKPLHTPHIDGNYMRSRHGQFRLIALDATHTRLEGTTWYQNYFWPQVYWRPLSDAIIHRIHERVLSHIRTQAELQVNQAPLSARSQSFSMRFARDSGVR